MKGLYIHIPFCKHICSYCDFPKKIAYNEEQITNYLNKLIKEINGLNTNLFDTIYIGGGTPNSLNNNNLELLLKTIKNKFNKYKEYTIECNPELINKEQVLLFKKYGINRVSLGVETFNDKGLKLLNRHHSEKDVINSVKLLKENDINNINIDLIYGYFNETIEDLKYDLEMIHKLNITHVSCYTLILEKNTLLYKLHQEKELNEDLIADMMDYTYKYLAKIGFNHYEISNFSKVGYESLHNLKYWNKEDYIGLGMGATSCINNKRITNSYFINNYLKDIDKSVEILDLIDLKKEFIIMGLRKIKGILKEDYYNKFNSKINDDFNYKKLIDLKLLEEDDKSLKLTYRGLFLANIVFEEFI